MSTFLAVWSDRYGEEWMFAADVDYDVRQIVGLGGAENLAVRVGQFLAKHRGTRPFSGNVLRSRPAGKGRTKWRVEGD